MPEFGADGPGFAIHDAEVAHMYESYQGEGAYYVVAERAVRFSGRGHCPLAGGEKGHVRAKKNVLLSEGEVTVSETCSFKKCSISRRASLQALFTWRRSNGWNEPIIFIKGRIRRIERPLGATGHFSCEPLVR